MKEQLNNEFIVITSSNFPTGGSSASYLNLFCKGLKSNGYTVRVLLLHGFVFGNYSSISNNRGSTDYGVSYTYMGFVQRPNNHFMKLIDNVQILLRLIIFLFSILKQRKHTSLFVYNNEAHTNIFIYIFCKLFKIKVFTFIPEFYDKSMFKGSIMRKLKWYGFLFNFYYLNLLSYKIIAFSHFIKDEYIRLGFVEEKILIQPNLTDFDFWKTNDPILKYTLGYSGTPTIKDGLHDLIKAVKLLEDEKINISLIIIGDSLSGESLIPPLKKECEKLKISECITFTGLVTSDIVKEYLSQCRILVLTRPLIKQTQAGFPTKLGEYFAIKRPVLTTNFGDIEKYFTDGIDLIVAESGNSESIAQKIRYMIQNPLLINKMSEIGYNRARDLLDYQKSMGRIINFILT